jgi:hypothetical protein
MEKSREKTMEEIFSGLPGRNGWILFFPPTQA